MRSTIDDLEAIGEAAADFPLITGGSGIALGLPENFRRQGLLGDSAAADALPPIAGAAVVLSGSCSEATRAQVAYMRERAPVFTIDPIAAAAGRNIAEEALAWAAPRLGDRPVLISATAPPEEVAAIQEAARPRARRRIGRGDARGSRSRPCRARGAAPRHRRRRDRRGDRPGARRHRAAHRPADRSRRAVDDEPPGSPASRRWHWRSNPAISARPISSCAPFPSSTKRWQNKHF